ncbi:hypothetical protein [Nocardioides panaciterrulae]|uniref:DNA-binding transcriptional regulator of glucitol operon n=1 Tax=Nocardioides panaciterrulae TaxID=661492 RepID=A0A7Y9E4L4_9ACTN|nr:hypothetical protein [Nocardioides panaciterrulae]NYD41148.1 hypothetical protein [Nocardioides panaciterrulae]
MSGPPGTSSRLRSRAAVRYHLVFLPAVCLCLAAGWFELTRARHGHQIAWAYCVEWPMFAVVFGVMWWHVVSERESRRPSPPRPHTERDIPADDPGLQAWRDYLDAFEHDDDGTDRAPGSG